MLSVPSFAIVAACASTLTAATPLRAQLDTVKRDGTDNAAAWVPGVSNLYTTYRGVAPPFPVQATAPILPTRIGAPAPDDELFQNLLAAEWAIYSFYQAGVEAFNAAIFEQYGWPNNTYDRLQEIRNIEAGHLRIFQDAISDTSVKSGICKYDFGFSDPVDFLAIQTIIELASLSFISGLVQQTTIRKTQGILVTIAESETRHEAWSLIDIWNADPFSGPSDTSYPYANQILDTTNRFVIPGSCPSANPEYPSPNQHLPQLAFNATATDPSIAGFPITFTFANPNNTYTFNKNKPYYAVFFHGTINITMPFFPANMSTNIPDLDMTGAILVVLTTKPGAPTNECCIAGPATLVQSPSQLIGLN